MIQKLGFSQKGQFVISVLRVLTTPSFDPNIKYIMYIEFKIHFINQGFL